MGHLEADFGLHELFFSKTDFKGLIQSGNKVFVRVSEFASEDLKNRPHNIIRHPDMPRTVFKLLWDFLHSKRPIVAYVKNRSRLGRYYWVLAMVFPMSDGYLSIRLKPTSPLFDKTKKIYQEMLFQEDSRESLDEAVQILEGKIKSLGFKDYDDFMVTALLSELKSRDDIYKSGISQTSQHFKRNSFDLVLMATRECTAASRAAFKIADFINQQVVSLKERSNKLTTLCQQVRLITTNLTISSSRLGESGKPLTVVSQNLERLTADIDESTKDFNQTFKAFEEKCHSMHFSLATSRFQIEMMHHLLEETVYDLATSDNLSDEQVQQLNYNCSLLKTLISENFLGVERNSRDLIKESKSLAKSISALSRVTAGMDVICVVGKIEMARLEGLSQSLEALLNEMTELTQGFKEELRLMESDSQFSLTKSNDLKIHLSHISSNLKKVEPMVFG